MAADRRSFLEPILLGVLAATMRGAESSHVTLDHGLTSYQVAATSPGRRRRDGSPFSSLRVGERRAHDHSIT